MTTPEIIRKEDAHLIPTYRKMPLALVRGEGTWVWDSNGKKYLDCYGGHCVTILGHCPPRVTAALKRQSEKLLFYSNVVYSDVRATAAMRLAKMAPLRQIFFCNSGTEAVETALKIARKATQRSGIIAMEGDFHGRTLGSLATTWNSNYRAPYADMLAETVFAPFGDLSAVEAILQDNRDIAAVILEPIQSIAGIVQAPDEYYRELRALCNKYGVLLIFDEIQTGVGRTGTFSMSEQMGMLPDLITLAKSLGGGMPVGAVLASDALAEGVQYGDQGSTFGGGMLAMAAVDAVLTTLQAENLMQRAAPIFEQIVKATRPYVQEVRGRGCLIGLKLDMPAKPVLAALRERNVLAGGSADPHVIRLMPPLTTSGAEIDFFAQAFADTMATLHE